MTEDERLTVAEADRRSADLARGLLAVGAGHSSHIGLLFPSGADFIVAWLAAARIGAVASLRLKHIDMDLTRVFYLQVSVDLPDEAWVRLRELLRERGIQPGLPGSEVLDAPRMRPSRACTDAMLQRTLKRLVLSPSLRESASADCRTESDFVTSFDW